MGSFSVVAEFFRPPQLDNKQALRESFGAPGNRFDDYLKEAGKVDPKDRSGAPEDDKKVDEAEPRDDVKSRDEAESAEPSKKDEAAASTEAVVAPVVDIISQVAIANGKEVVIEAGDLNERAVQSVSEKNAKSGANITNNSNFDSRETAKPIHGAEPVVDASSTTVDSQNKNIRTEATPLDALRTALDKPAQVEAKTDGVDLDANAKQATEEAVNGNASKQAVNKDNNSKEVSIDRASRESNVDKSLKQGADERQAVVPRESVFQRKVREATNDRREAPSVDSANKNNGDKDKSGPKIADNKSAVDTPKQQLGRNDSDATSNGGRYPRLLAQAYGASDDNTATGTIKSASGDGAAVSAFRLLTEGAIDTARPGATTGVDTGSSAAVTASQSTSNVARPIAATSNPGAIVGDLLNASVDKADGAEALAKVLHASSVPGRHTATLRLDPPSLGQVKVQIDLRHEGLTLQVNTESREVARLVESRLNDLKESLASHGIKVERTDVVVHSPESQDANFKHSHSNGDGSAGFDGSHDAQGQGHSSDTHGSSHADRDRESFGGIEPIERDATDNDESVIETTNERPWSETTVNLVA